MSDTLKRILMYSVLALVGVGAVVGLSQFGEMNSSPTGPPLEARASGEWTDPDAERSIPLNEIQSGGVPKDGIPSIDEPEFGSWSDVEKVFEANSRVYLTKGPDGKTVKAYPYSILVHHEIVNDTVGGVPVAVTYCPLCGTTFAYRRELNGQTVEFGVSGRLYKSNLLMYDRQTDSLWSQLEGQAVVGEMTGTELELYPGQTLEYRRAKQKYPQARVLTTDTGYNRNYTRWPYGDYAHSEEVMFGSTPDDDRLHPKTVMAYLEIDGEVLAWPVKQLRDLGSHSEQWNGREISVEVNDAGEILVAVDGEETAWKRTFWFALVAHRPDTELSRPASS